MAKWNYVKLQKTKILSLKLQIQIRDEYVIFFKKKKNCSKRIKI